MVIGRAVLGLVGLVPVFGSRPDFATDRAAVVVDLGDFTDAIEESRVVITVLAALHFAPPVLIGRQQRIGVRRQADVPNETPQLF